MAKQIQRKAMKEMQIFNKQSLFDLSIQNYGTIEAIIDLALENNLSVTDELQTGDLVNVPQLGTARLSIVSYYKRNQIKPATGFTAVDNPDIVPDDSCNYCKLFE